MWAFGKVLLTDQPKCQFRKYNYIIKFTMFMHSDEWADIISREQQTEHSRLLNLWLQQCPTRRLLNWLECAKTRKQATSIQSQCYSLWIAKEPSSDTRINLSICRFWSNSILSSLISRSFLALWWSFKLCFKQQKGLEKNVYLGITDTWEELEIGINNRDLAQKQE